MLASHFSLPVDRIRDVLKRQHEFKELIVRITNDVQQSNVEQHLKKFLRRRRVTTSESWASGALSTRSPTYDLLSRKYGENERMGSLTKPEGSMNMDFEPVGRRLGFSSTYAKYIYLLCRQEALLEAMKTNDETIFLSSPTNQEAIVPSSPNSSPESVTPMSMTTSLWSFKLRLPTVCLD